jgi:hypothetical protein
VLRGLFGYAASLSNPASISSFFRIFQMSVQRVMWWRFEYTADGRCRNRSVLALRDLTGFQVAGGKRWGGANDRGATPFPSPLEPFVEGLAADPTSAEPSLISCTSSRLAVQSAERSPSAKTRFFAMNPGSAHTPPDFAVLCHHSSLNVKLWLWPVC